MSVLSIVRPFAYVLWLVCLFAIRPVLAAETLPQLQQLAQTGDARAQYQLAERYYRGEGAPRDYRQALKWYQQSASNGYADAQYQLGYLHQHGPDLVKKDDKTAFDWYLKAANQGHLSAQTKVSLMYRMGKGVEKNPALARKWSMAVLKRKGLLEEEKPATSAAAKPAARNTSPKRVQSGKGTTSPAKKTMTEAEKKAWRREQARKLVEKMNREAAEAGAWSDVDE